jgi:hypothetical protein
VYSFLKNHLLLSSCCHYLSSCPRSEIAAKIKNPAQARWGSRACTRSKGEVAPLYSHRLTHRPRILGIIRGDPAGRTASKILPVDALGQVEFDHGRGDSITRNTKNPAATSLRSFSKLKLRNIVALTYCEGTMSLEEVETF